MYNYARIQEFITAPLTISINKCLEEGVFPEKLNISKILPIHKKGGTETARNFRTTAITPVISKLSFNKHNIL